jgi:hypothetical protein
MRRSERAAEVARMPGRVMILAPARRPVPAGVGGRQFDDLPEFDPAAFEDAAAFEDDDEGPAEDGPSESGFSGEGLSDELGHGLTDSLASEPSALPEPGHELELDDVDLAELETGDGLGELEVLIGLTDLPGNARCLAAA